MKMTLMTTAMTALLAMPAFAGSLAAPVMEEQIVAPTLMEAPMPTLADIDYTTWDGFYVGGGLSNTSQDDPDGSGMELDLRAGYNFDLGDVVLGVEGIYAPLGFELDGAAGDMESTFTAKARVGYDMGEFMPYATLGVTSAKADFGAGEVSDTGTVYGVGVDYKMTQKVVVGGEFTKTTFDDFDGTGNDVDQTKLGVNVKYSF